MAKVLVIEDEADIRQLLQYNLEAFGHEVLTASSGGEALQLARDARPALVLLDLMLPDLAGTELCRKLRAEPATATVPILMLTARGEEGDRVAGFEAGADDYVTKPFSVRELTLRVQALLRRGGGATSPEVKADDSIHFGVLRVDRDAHRVWVREQEIELTALEFRLLVTLHDRRNRVQTRAALLNDVWGIEAEITTRTVDTHVKRLREKLSAAGDYIETVRGVGYRFADRPDAHGG